MTRSLRVTRLESRLAPAIGTWDGGGADNLWTTAANWVGDVAPQPGDDLVFPSGAARLTNANDFAVGTPIGSLRFTGFAYDVTGNAIALSNGISIELPAPATPMANPRST